MYGPPPDALQQLAPTGLYGAWHAWLACVVAGLLLAAWAGPRRPLLAALGGVVALTTPAAAFFGRYVWGAFPTIDKAGSLLFYRDGVLGRAFDPDDPAVRRARLALVAATAQVLKNGLRILGVSAPEQM